jgi:hypothetical protein
VSWHPSTELHRSRARPSVRPRAETTPLEPGRWRTLGNGKRIKLDADGRIVAGMPRRYRGTHVGDLSQLSHEERELQGIDCADVGAICPTCRQTFPTKDAAFLAILEANPELHALQQSEYGAYDAAFLKWQRGGRRGPKPRTRITDGRLDAINEFYDLRGADRVGSFTEAIYHTIPSSRRWEDLPPRLRQLSEASGLDVQPPDESNAIEVAKQGAADCADEVDRRLGELFERAQAGRLDGDEPDDEEAPF